MYKWNTVSASGRIRPLTADAKRVTDGIAASLRQFHISASRAAQEPTTTAPRSRAQRSAQAAAEIASIPSRARGVDARSLAAEPAKGPLIKKYFRGDEQPQGRSSSRGRGGQIRGAVGGRGAGRGRGRGTIARGSRGGRGGRGKATDGRAQAPSDNEVEDKNPSWSPEEQAYLDAVDQGVLIPSSQTRNRESLVSAAPGVPLTSTTIGIIDTIRSRMMALTQQPHNGSQTAEEHWRQYYLGNGTLFQSSEEKAKVIETSKEGKYDLSSIEQLSEVEQMDILRNFGAGPYTKLKQPTKEDTLTSVETYTALNRTYLPKDGEMFKKRVQQLLPAIKAQAPGKQARN